MSTYCSYFGFKTEPFSSEISSKNLLKLPSMVSVKERFDYVMNGGVFIVTGEVGSGKSTSLRWTQGQYHPSQHLFLNITATGGSLIEFYRQLCWGLDVEAKTGSRAYILKVFKNNIREIVATKKQKIIIVIDEAHLLRTEIFAELHTITQFDNDSKNLFSIVLAGQPNLIEKMTYRSSSPLASRVVARTHLTHLNQEQMVVYLEHHLNVAGTKKQLFSDQAITAIYQGSAGILRKTNLLAKGGLIAAAMGKEQVVTAEHIRLASTELI
jgi:type II secretory pathway predicted ATPase ExeA